VQRTKKRQDAKKQAGKAITAGVHAGFSIQNRRTLLVCRAHGLGTPIA
jgi:hypothetical protein